MESALIRIPARRHAGYSLSQSRVCATRREGQKGVKHILYRMFYAQFAGAPGIHHRGVSSAVLTTGLTLCPHSPDWGNSGAPGKRTVASALPVMCLSDERHFRITI